jgi:hypothetical protein
MNQPTVPRYTQRLVDHLIEVGATEATNAELAAQLGCSTRLIRYAIAAGAVAGVISVERRAADAATDPSGRTITLAGGVSL